MSEVYFIADLHLSHDGALSFRSQFSTLTEHDGLILKNIYDTVGKRDTLYLLGDCFMTALAFEKFWEAVGESIGKIVLVPGNHDFERMSFTERKHLYNRVLECGIDIRPQLSYKKYTLTHAPMHEDHLRDKFNIHGHLHHRIIPDGRYINVSCEAVNYTPLSLKAIEVRAEAYKTMNKKIGLRELRYLSEPIL